MRKKRNRDKRFAVSIVMPPSLLASLDKLAEKKNRSRSNLTVELIRETLAQRGVVGYDG
jgi:metal-responsive CopG/Arc/MetJ family transcriptional regulator